MIGKSYVRGCSSIVRFKDGCAEQGGQQVGERQYSRSDRTRLPAQPARRPFEDAILDVRAQNPGREPFDRAERIVEAHHEVARVERDPRHRGIETIQQPEQFVGRQIGVSFDGHLQAKIPQAGREPNEDIPRGVDLADPGRIGAKPIVAVADVEADVAAAQRDSGLGVAGEFGGVLGGGDVAAFQARPPDGIRRGNPDLQI